MEHFKTAIIGGGPGGYETAIRLNQLGISTVCFEKERLGGVCLNKGCIPTKALVKVADLYHEMRTADEYGLENFTSEINYEKIYNRKNQVVEKLVSGIEFLFKKRQIPNYKKAVTKVSTTSSTEAGRYQLYSNDELCCTADHVIIATGSAPKQLPFLPFDGKRVLSSDHILAMSELPKSLTIVGGGVIGCEFACIYKQLGVDVNIVEFLPEIVPFEDEEISKRLAMALKKMGIKVLTQIGVESGSLTDEGVELRLSSGKSIVSEKILVSVGRKPVFDIETSGFELKNNSSFIEVNEFCQTSESGIFAIGDVTGKLMLAHTASKQGLLVADFINSKINNQKMHLHAIEYHNIPSCVFTNPEVASCGLTEKQAKEKLAEIKVGRFPYAANGKALSSGATYGFVKTIVNAETDEIVGMHIIGYLATELIAQASILISSRAKVTDVANIIFAHPTISECVMESVEDTHKMAIHTI